MALAPLSAIFQSLPLLPTIKLGPSGAESRVGGFVYILGPCSSLQRTLLWDWEFLLLLPQPPQVFSIIGLRLYFPPGALVCVVCFAPPLFLPVYLSECGASGASRHHLVGSASYSLACPVPQSSTLLCLPAAALQ